MTFLSNDPLTQLAFSVHENKGVFAVLIGSGLSRSAEIPTGWEITLDLVRRVAKAQGVEDQPDWAQWYRDTAGKEPNYSTLLEDIANSPDERRAIIHRYVEPSEADREEGRKIPTDAHHAIAKLVRSGHIRVIVTTNFDRLMENALREQGVEPTVISSVDQLAGAEPLTHSQCYLLKLHGDYKDARILNTDEELRGYPEGYDRLLDRIFDEHGLIVCGWSGEWDHALRAAALRAPNRRYPMFWAARGDVGTGAQEIVDQRRARVAAVRGADEFFSQLLQRVETLEQSRRQNPLSVELLVSSVKRFLAKPEYRIQLDDLLAQETARAIEQLDSDVFTPSGAWDEESFRQRVKRYDAIAEPLARVAGALGRWGEGGELPLVIDIIKGLWHHAESVGSGMNIWLGLRSYPAVLIFTAYGVGLARSERWGALHALFSAEWVRESRAPEPLVSVLFLQSWKGDGRDTWRNLDGLASRRTPLSDHLFDVMSEWKSSFAGVSADFELVFNRFETLGSLAYLEVNDEAGLEQSWKNNPSQIFARMPMGRVGWHDSFETLVRELESDKTIEQFLEAGFAHNSRRFLELFILNLRSFQSKLSW